PSHRIFGGQNLEYGEWRMGNDLLSRSFAAQKSHVRDAEAVMSNLHSQLGARLDTQFILPSRKEGNQYRLPGCMIVLSHRALLDHTIHVLAVGIRGCPQVFFD